MAADVYTIEKEILSIPKKTGGRHLPQRSEPDQMVWEGTEAGYPRMDGWPGEER